MHDIIPCTEDTPCCMCGKKARFVEINYEAAFCSTACLDEMDKAYFAANQQKRVFEHEDF